MNTKMFDHKFAVEVCTCGCGIRAEHRGDRILLVDPEKSLRVEVNYAEGSFINGNSFNADQAVYLPDSLQNIVTQWQFELNAKRVCPVCFREVMFTTKDFRGWGAECVTLGCLNSVVGYGESVREAYEDMSNSVAKMVRPAPTSDPRVISGSLWVELNDSGAKTIWDLYGLDYQYGWPVWIGDLPKEWIGDPNKPEIKSRNASKLSWLEFVDDKVVWGDLHPLDRLEVNAQWEEFEASLDEPDSYRVECERESASELAEAEAEDKKLSREAENLGEAQALADVEYVRQHIPAGFAEAVDQIHRILGNVINQVSDALDSIETFVEDEQTSEDTGEAEIMGEASLAEWDEERELLEQIRQTLKDYDGSHEGFLDTKAKVELLLDMFDKGELSEFLGEFEE